MTASGIGAGEGTDNRAVGKAEPTAPRKTKSQHKRA